MRKLNRAVPRLGAEKIQTFQVTSPVSTHWRTVSCEEVACPLAENGWRMVIDLNTNLGREQAYYIKHESGRKFTHASTASGMVELTFSSGQPCFQEHKVRLEDRTERFLVKGGDYRGNPLRTPTRVHKKAEFWLEEFQENQDRLIRLSERG